MSDIVKRLRSANTWLNEGECCGQIDASGTCMAPACIFGEALKLSTEAADEIEKLRAGNQKAALEYLGQIGQLSDENTRLRAALRECEAELDDYYRNEYSGTHPYNEKKLKQAMAANPARAALEEE